MPNGDRVTVTAGWRGGRNFKTVTVRRPDGTSDSRTDDRGFVGTEFRGNYDLSIPDWAGGGRVATHRPTRDERWVGWLGAAVIIAVMAGLTALFSGSPNSYQDGRSWALKWQTTDGSPERWLKYAITYGLPEPWIGCNRNDMEGIGTILVRLGRGVQGAAEDEDNYAQWRAGCLSTKAYYLRQWAHYFGKK